MSPRVITAVRAFDSPHLHMYVREIFALTLLSLLVLFYGSALANIGTDLSLDYSEWDLVHENNFTYDSDLDAYDTKYIWSRGTIINDESQFYADADEHGWNPFDVKDGKLLITASPTPEERLNNFSNQPYVSGVITSRTQGFSQQYGLWEIRAKLPKAQGAWPAFWMLPTFRDWPEGVSVLSEIDVLEGIAGVEDGVYQTAFHTNQNGKLESQSNAIETEQDLTLTYNVYSLEWNAQYLVWYFNGEEVWRGQTPDDMHAPRHYLLNLAVGGWGGEPDVEDYPASFQVDWVRVYRNIEPVFNTPLEQDLANGETPFTFEGLGRIIEFLKGIATGGNT